MALCVTNFYLHPEDAVNKKPLIVIVITNTEGEDGACKLMKGGEAWRRGRRMREMFNHS